VVGVGSPETVVPGTDTDGVDTVAETVVDGSVASTVVEGSVADTVLDGTVAETVVEDGTVADTVVDGSVAETVVTGVLAATVVEGSVAATVVADTVGDAGSGGVPPTIGVGLPELDVVVDRPGVSTTPGMLEAARSVMLRELARPAAPDWNDDEPTVPPPEAPADTGGAGGWLPEPLPEEGATGGAFEMLAPATAEVGPLPCAPTNTDVATSAVASVERDDDSDSAWLTA
jgi:hypothetical protein